MQLRMRGSKPSPLQAPELANMMPSLNCRPSRLCQAGVYIARKHANLQVRRFCAIEIRGRRLDVPTTAFLRQSSGAAEMVADKGVSGVVTLAMATSPILRGKGAWVHPSWNLYFGQSARAVEHGLLRSSLTNKAFAALWASGTSMNLVSPGF